MVFGWCKFNACKSQQNAEQNIGQNVKCIIIWRSILINWIKTLIVIRKSYFIFFQTLSSILIDIKHGEIFLDSLNCFPNNFIVVQLRNRGCRILGGMCSYKNIIHLFRFKKLASWFVMITQIRPILKTEEVCMWIYTN